MRLSELIAMIYREFEVMKLPDGTDMELIIRSDVEDYGVADFSIRCDPVSGRDVAIIEMGDVKP